MRYLHLNPLRADVVPDLPALGRYRWTGHAVLLSQRPHPWQDTRTALARFAPTRRVAREQYRIFVGEGVPQGRRPDLQEGGLRRSAGCWAGVCRPALGPGTLGGRRAHFGEDAWGGRWEGNTT